MVEGADSSLVLARVGPSRDSMPKILIIHHDSVSRDALAKMLATHHQVIIADTINAGLKGIRQHRPDLGIGGLDAKQLSILTLLKFLKDNKFDVPMLLVANADAGQHQPAAMKLGAKGFLEYPIEAARLHAHISMTLQDFHDTRRQAVPITSAEDNGNLSDIERTFNRQMRCFAGKNLVFLQSMITGVHRTQPRICLKCPLRREFGMTERIYHDYIRDVCIGDHESCPAVQKFQARAGI